MPWSQLNHRLLLNSFSVRGTMMCSVRLDISRRWIFKPALDRARIMNGPLTPLPFQHRVDNDDQGQRLDSADKKKINGCYYTNSDSLVGQFNVSYTTWDPFRPDKLTGELITQTGWQHIKNQRNPFTSSTYSSSSTETTAPSSSSHGR